MSAVVPPYRRGGGFGTLGSRLREVFEPTPPALSPQTLGAWLTLAALALLLLTAAALLIRRHHRRRHRRAAARELSALRAAWSEDPQARDALEQVSPILKRCALGSFRRERVASLSGERWLAFLDTTCPRPLGDDARRALLTLTTRGAAAVSTSDVAGLFAAAARWIRSHRADV